MKKNSMLLVSLALLAASAARADVVIPSSAFSAGKNLAEFHSDVRVYNPTSDDALVTPVFYNQADGQKYVAADFTVPAKSQVAFDNMLASVFARPLGSFGPIRFKTAAPLVVSSSVNNVNACGSGAVSGQWLPGIDVADALLGGTLVQLGASTSEADGTRSNVVFMNPSLTTPALVTLFLRKGDGTLLSSRTITLGINGFAQLSLTDQNFPGMGSITDTNLFLHFAGDQPILSFASVINNASGDPFAVVGVGQKPAPPVVDPPVASYTVSANPQATLPLTFTSTSTGATSYFWVFGDGAFDATSGATATHTYAAQGTFATALVVANASGAANATKSVPVAAAPVQGTVRVDITATTNGDTLWQFKPSPIVLTVGQNYDLVFTSNDKMHGVTGLATLGITKCFTLQPNVPCTINFTPTAQQKGAHNFICSQMTCGTGHNSMSGQLKIQ